MKHELGEMIANFEDNFGFDSSPQANGGAGGCGGSGGCGGGGGCSGGSGGCGGSGGGTAISLTDSDKDD